MDGKGKRSDKDKRPETEQARSDSLPETTRPSNVPSGQHYFEMDSAEIHETGDLLEGTVSKVSQQREHASDSTESSSSESELEREKERLLAEEKRLSRARRKQLRAEINELQATVENKKVQKQSLTLGMDGKGKRSDKDKRPETEQARSDSLPETTMTSISNVIGMSGGHAENCNIYGQNIHVNDTCHHLQDLISETGLMINSMDASKHVSTHAEGAAYKHLVEQGCVVIRGRSGSGKSHMGYTLLQRASKQFPRKPVKISSPDEWNYLPKSMGQMCT
ncbi:uncharacterized protein [Haliotis cracherodii]|uniref:uncharacterized protein isoform X2 n=1 Tax=Haliotis cracherodii TaxID=6455 RepID=UPI0039E9C993